MIYARIDNGIVVELIDDRGGDINTMFHPSIVSNLVATDDNTIINGTYDGTTFGGVLDKPLPSQEQINQEARQYLESTDWMLLRELDGGAAMDATIKQLRIDARSKVI